MTAADYFDDLETQSAEAREERQTRMLRERIRGAKRSAPAQARRLAEVDPEALAGTADLAGIPVLRKSELAQLQADEPPFGGLSTVAAGMAGRIFTSPGPIYELEDRESDYGRLARAFYASGMRAGDILHNSFAYHLTPGGWIVDWGARALGCAVVPAGVGNSEQQIAAIQHLRPSAFAGTPDYLKVLLDKAAEIGGDMRSIRRAWVSGGALFPSLRQEYAERGVQCLQGYATAELGLIAYETLAPDGSVNPGMLVDEGVIVEIVRPGTDDPLPAGEVGEVVVTNFCAAYPMIRLGTGDLSALLPDESPCGRTGPRIKGWMGRADQTTKVKGMFVHPQQVAAVLKRHPEVAKARLVVTRDGAQDAMTLQAESTAGADLAAGLAESLQQATKLRGAVEIVAPGSLPNDGKVIDDQRKYD